MRKAAAISLVLLTLTLCFILVVHQLRQEAGKTAEGAINLVKQVLNITPETTITTYVSTQKTTDILELASVSKKFPVDYTYEQTLLGSTKKLVLHGEYTVKAGFDLHERFGVQIDETTRKVRADFPAPKILSVQQDTYKVVQDSSGYWNALSQEDQQAAVNGMNAKARAAALELKVLQDSEDSLRRQMLDLAKRTGQDWEVRFRDESEVLPRTGKD